VRFIAMQSHGLAMRVPMIMIMVMVMVTDRTIRMHVRVALFYGMGVSMVVMPRIMVVVMPVPMIMIVIVVMIVVVVVMVMSVMMMMMVMMRAVQREGIRLHARIVGDGRDQPGDIRLDCRVVATAFTRLLIHVEAAIDLDLQAMTMLAWIGEGTDQLHALIGIIHFHVIPSPAQKGLHKPRKLPRRGRTVPIAQNKIGAGLARVSAIGSPHRIHAVTIDMPHRPKLRMGGIQRILYGALIRLMKLSDPAHDFGRGEVPLIDRIAAIEQPPNQSNPLFDLIAVGHRPGPGRLKQQGIDID
jgi:hypothetical protein